jgi:hypothetical protein
MALKASTQTTIHFAMVLAAVAGGWWYFAQASPCSSGIRYRVGELDPRFRVSDREVLAALKKAEGLWEDALGRDLFRYDADAGMPVNLRFDTRQFVAQENSRHQDSIDRSSEDASSIKEEFDRKKAQYESAKLEFLDARQEHESRVAAYNRKVEAWNASGGVPAGEYDESVREKRSLDASTKALEDLRVALNQLGDRMNGLRDRYNRIADDVNDDVAAINRHAGQEFEQGQYVEAGSARRIDIFEFKDRDDLVRVLAHELGHAYGLGHIDDPASIMYPTNSKGTMAVGRVDAEALKGLCRF